MINYPALVDGSFFLFLKHKTIIQTADAIKKGPKKPSKLRKTIKIILLCRQRREDEEEVSWMKSFSADEKKNFRFVGKKKLFAFESERAQNFFRFFLFILFQ